MIQRSNDLVLKVQIKSGSIAKFTEDKPAVKRVAVVAKEPHTSRSIVAIMQSWNIAVSSYDDEFALYSAMKNGDLGTPDCIIIDTYLLQHTVVEIAQNIATENAQKMGIVVLSSIARKLPDAMNAVSLAKPYEPEQLRAAIRTAVGDE